MNLKALLEDPETPAVALTKALTKTLGHFWLWEPETIWLELTRQDVDFPVENRAKIMAVVALLLVPSFYWDAFVFEKTALAFSNVPGNPDILEEASPEQLAWAVIESSRIRNISKEHTEKFQHEPAAYAAIVLNRAAFVLAPKELSFAQEILDLTNKSHDMLEPLKKRWEALEKTRLIEQKLTESPEDIQIAKLSAVELFIQTQRAKADKALAACP